MTERKDQPQPEDSQDSVLRKIPTLKNFVSNIPFTNEQIEILKKAAQRQRSDIEKGKGTASNTSDLLPNQKLRN